jgi:tetratricopeptide (TPR) repeat protein
MGVKALAEGGDIRRALSIRDLIDSREERDIAATIVAPFIAKTGDTTGAQGIIGDIVDPSQRADALADLADVLEAGGRVEEASETVNQAIAAAQATRTWWRDFLRPGMKVNEKMGKEIDRSAALIELAGQLAAATAVERALSVADALEESVHRPIALSRIAIELAEAGSVPAAATIARRALATMQHPDDVTPHERADDATSSSEPAQVQPTVASPTSDEEIAATVTALAKPESRAWIYSLAAAILGPSPMQSAEAVDFARRALATGQRIRKRAVRRDIAWHLLRAAARLDDAAFARSVLEFAESAQLADASDLLTEERAEAARTQSEAPEVFSVIGFEAQRAPAYAWVAHALAESGARQDVEEPARAAREIARSLEFEEVRLETVQHLANAFGASGSPAALQQLQDELEELLTNAVHQLVAGAQIARAWAEIGDHQRVSAAVAEITRDLDERGDDVLRGKLWAWVGGSGRMWVNARRLPNACDAHSRPQCISPTRRPRSTRFPMSQKWRPRPGKRQLPRRWRRQPTHYCRPSSTHEHARSGWPPRATPWDTPVRRPVRWRRWYRPVCRSVRPARRRVSDGLCDCADTGAAEASRAAVGDSCRHPTRRRLVGRKGIART